MVGGLSLPTPPFLVFAPVCAVRDRLETRGESRSEPQSDTTGEVLLLVH